VRGINEPGWKEGLKSWDGHICWSFERRIEFGAAFVWHWHFKELATRISERFTIGMVFLRYPLS
jgi:hypothetical protein